MSITAKAVLACLLGSLVVLPTVAFADDSAVAKSDQSQSQTEEKRKTLLGDATGAIPDTQAALSSFCRDSCD